MRKFRVWDKEGSEWLDPTCCSVTGDGKVHCIQKKFGSLSGDETAGKVIIELSTGLKDKKRTKEFPDGQPIYEGDIVNWKGMEYGDTQDYPEDLIDVVDEIECCYGSNEWFRNSTNQCEVIGNIHQNPDLLK